MEFNDVLRSTLRLCSKDFRVPLKSTPVFRVRTSSKQPILSKQCFNDFNFAMEMRKLEFSLGVLSMMLSVSGKKIIAQVDTIRLKFSKTSLDWRPSNMKFTPPCLEAFFEAIRSKEEQMETFQQTHFASLFAVGK